jgi:hypothetical protein
MSSALINQKGDDLYHVNWICSWNRPEYYLHYTMRQAEYWTSELPLLFHQFLAITTEPLR